MQPPNATWQQIIAQATQSPDILKQPEVIHLSAQLMSIALPPFNVCRSDLQA
jgi:hypothetical protein